MRIQLTLGLLALLAADPGRPSAAQPSFSVDEITIAKLHGALADGKTTCRAVVRAYIDRIAAYDAAGPRLDAMRALNPHALAQAEAFDRAGSARAPGPLGCVPLVVKDNYATADMPTTEDRRRSPAPGRPRTLPTVAKLRTAGAIILGKTNEGRLLGLAYAFEQAQRVRRPPRSTPALGGDGARAPD